MTRQDDLRQLYRKLAGKPAVDYPPRIRKPCVGMCFRTRSSGVKVAAKRKERRSRKPCIGLCFIAKMKTTSTASPLVEEETVKVEHTEDISVGNGNEALDKAKLEE